MDDPQTTALFLITGLITACGSHQAMPILHKAQMKVVNKQYLEAIFAAEKIVQHYPGTPFSESARTIIDLINRQHLDEEYTVTV